MSFIEINNLEFGYTKERILKNVNFRQEEGQIVAIHGANGSGKSTFLKVLLGELKAQKGEVKLLGQDIKVMRDFRKIGYVPQVQNFNGITFPVTTLEIVALGLYRDFGFIKIPRKRHIEKARETLVELGMEQYLHVPYNQLSGGFKQRTMIARAMINRPEILILDEPTAGVDQKSKENFLKLIAETNRKKSTTILIVTHEMDFVKEYLHLDASYKMEEGVLVQC